MKTKPAVFVGSSTEGLPIAQALQVLLDYSCEVEIWSQGVFGLSQGGLESLVLALDRFDFAILVLSADDLVTKRSETLTAARDNVLFELGLFTGGLGRERTYMLYERSKPPELPTDLAGITAATFELHSSRNLEASLGAAATRIQQQIQRLGLRGRREIPRLTHATNKPWVIVDSYSSSWSVDEETGEEYLSESIHIVNQGEAPAVNIVIPDVKCPGWSARFDIQVPTLGPGQSTRVTTWHLSEMLRGVSASLSKKTAQGAEKESRLIGYLPVSLPLKVEYRGPDHNLCTTDQKIVFIAPKITFAIADPDDPQQWTDLSVLEEQSKAGQGSG